MKQNYDINKEDIRLLLDFAEQEIDDTEQALIQWTQAYAIAPPLSIQQDIFEKIKKLNAHKANPQAYDLINLPLLSSNADWLVWKETVKDIKPPEAYVNVHLHTLESNEKRDLFLAFVKEVIPEETHHDFIESFILLEGSCVCHITQEDGKQQTVHMRSGDYILFQLGEIHDILITSSTPVMAILQWLKVAA